MSSTTACAICCWTCGDGWLTAELPIAPARLSRTTATLISVGVTPWSELVNAEHAGPEPPVAPGTTPDPPGTFAEAFGEPDGVAGPDPPPPGDDVAAGDDGDGCPDEPAGPPEPGDPAAPGATPSVSGPVAPRPPVVGTSAHATRPTTTTVTAAASPFSAAELLRSQERNCRYWLILVPP